MILIKSLKFSVENGILLRCWQSKVSKDTARHKPSVWEGSGARVLLTLLQWDLGWSLCNTFNPVQLPYEYSCWGGGWHHYPCLSLSLLNLKRPVIPVKALLELFTIACVGTFEVKCHECLLSGGKVSFTTLHGPEEDLERCFLQGYPKKTKNKKDINIDVICVKFV